MKIFSRFNHTVMPAPTITAEVIQREIVDKQDSLMQEVRDILSAAEKKAQGPTMASRLMNLGFMATPQVQQEVAEKTRTDLANRQHDYERAHALKYPGMKFILKEVMEQVCEKYGLLVGNVSRYTGEVPEWAVAAIERSGLMKEVWVVRRRQGPSPLYPHGYVSDFYPWTPHNKEAVIHAASTMGDGWCAEMETNLLIAAPMKEMKVLPRERIEKGRIVQVKDPIVCIEVDGGYVVIAAWGEEGQDPRVFNADRN